MKDRIKMEVQPTRPRSGRDKPVIIVAEDSGLQLRLMQMCLQRADYSVVEAHDGVEALAHIETELPDLVTLDIDMPRMNGFQVLDRMRRDPRLRAIPVVMLTAHAKDSGLFREWATARDTFMTKPFSPEQLLTAVQRTLSAAPSSPDPLSHSVGEGER
jgi:CheY-like chemotaxis protein